MRETDSRGRPVVTQIVADSPAEEAGFEVGDALAAFNGISTSEGEETVSAEVKRAMIPGEQITITVLRHGQRIDLAVTLGRIPDALVAQWIGYHMLEGHSDEAVAEAPKP